MKIKPIKQLTSLRIDLEEYFQKFVILDSTVHRGVWKPLFPSFSVSTFMMEKKADQIDKINNFHLKK